MGAAEPGLAALQQWLQRQIVGEGASRSAQDAGNTAGLRDIIRGSPALPAEMRIAIYARSYVLRLIECLREEFPVLRGFVGDQVFDLFAGAYIARRPSRSYSLYQLGAEFADFLEATRPADCGGPGALEAIPASLARLERAIAEAQRASGIERAPEPDLPLDTLVQLLPELRLRLPDTVRLLHLDFDFADTLSAARRGERAGTPPARATYIAVARSNYQVRVHALEPARFAWLQAIGPHGAEMRGAVAAAARQTGRAAGAVMADLLAWLPDAIVAGLLTKLPRASTGERMHRR